MKIIFEEEIFYEIDGARAFEISVYDFCNWGKALTSSVVEYANNIRRYVTAAAMDENRQLMKDRYDTYLQQVHAASTLRENTRWCPTSVLSNAARFIW